jgi:hypothetical protein
VPPGPAAVAEMLGIRAQQYFRHACPSGDNFLPGLCVKLRIRSTPIGSRLEPEGRLCHQPLNNHLNTHTRRRHRGLRGLVARDLPRRPVFGLIGRKTPQRPPTRCADRLSTPSTVLIARSASRCRSMATNTGSYRDPYFRPAGGPSVGRRRQQPQGSTHGKRVWAINHCSSGCGAASSATTNHPRGRRRSEEYTCGPVRARRRRLRRPAGRQSAADRGHSGPGREIRSSSTAGASTLG